MRKGILYSVLIVLVLSNAMNASSQTALSLGDIAFTGFNIDAKVSGANADGGDHFSFVILRTGGIAAGTRIRFTDRGWNTGACGTNGWSAVVESDFYWTASSALAYGAQVRISSIGTASTGTVTGTFAGFAATGDQIFAVQSLPITGPGTDVTGSHTMLAGMHMNEEVGVTSATNWDNQPGASLTAAQSNRPTCVVNGTHGLFINTEVDNARIKGSVILSGNPATDRSRINNAANWDVSDATPFDLPGPLSGLPVNFTSIKAFQKGVNVDVEWNVGTEDQLKHYVIERSFDGRLFTEVGTVAAIGKGSYSWSDIKPMDGSNFYRIRAVDLDESFKYSSIAIVNLSKGGKAGINVYPTVVRSGQFNLQITNMPAGSYRLQMYNSNGQVVLTRTINHTGGSATQSVNLPAATAKGLYRINMFTANDNVVTNIIVE